jgi:hypothetical protein
MYKRRLNQERISDWGSHAPLSPVLAHFAAAECPAATRLTLALYRDQLYSP